MIARTCTRTACDRDAVATLTYDYADSLVVVGPLSLAREPHTYDLCHVHLERLTVPHGWQTIRHAVLSGDAG